MTSAKLSFILSASSNKLTPIQTSRINNQITAPEVRVINEKGENLGVMPIRDALTLASPESGLDLIEISSTTNPPIARLMSYDKYRYERDKAEKKERMAMKTAGVKRVQITARAAKNDLQVRLKKLEEFFANGHRVEIFLRLRGREKGNKPWAEEKMREFLSMIPVEYRMITAPRFSGQGLSTQIEKK